jgi:membrane protein insertase Oxa1/YidC/SpoIIIJ
MSDTEKALVSAMTELTKIVNKLMDDQLKMAQELKRLLREDK